MESIEPETINQWALVPFDPEKARTAMLASLINQMTLEARYEGSDENGGVEQLVGNEIPESRNLVGEDITEGGGDEAVVDDETVEGGAVENLMREEPMGG